MGEPTDHSAVVSRDVWLAERRKGVGGSDVAAILGLDPYRTALDVYLDKVDRHPSPIDDDDPPEPILWGNLLEPVVADEVARRTGLLCQRVGSMVHPEHDWMRVNIDRVLLLGGEFVRAKSYLQKVEGTGTYQVVWERDWSDAPNPGVLECKTTSAWRRKDWADGGTPHPAVVQVCWAMAVTGWQWGKVAGLVGGQRLEIRDVDYDEALIDLIIQRVGSFWHDHVLTRTQPPVVARDTALLRRLYQGGSGALTATSEIFDARDRYLRYRDYEAEYRQLKKQAEAELRQLAGDHDEVVDITGERLMWFTTIAPVEVSAHTRPGTRRINVAKDPQ